MYISVCVYTYLCVYTYVKCENEYLHFNLKYGVILALIGSSRERIKYIIVFCLF